MESTLSTQSHGFHDLLYIEKSIGCSSSGVIRTDAKGYEEILLGTMEMKREDLSFGFMARADKEEFVC